MPQGTKVTDATPLKAAERFAQTCATRDAYLNVYKDLRSRRFIALLSSVPHPGTDNYELDCQYHQSPTQGLIRVTEFVQRYSDAE